MASDRQIVANQGNAKSSTGPRSKKGREASSQNARRHGLAVPHWIGTSVPRRHREMAELLAPSGSPLIKEHACEAAEAELELLRIRMVRAKLFDELLFSQSISPDGLAELDDKLGKLERYERRAFSRRKTALRATFN